MRVLFRDQYLLAVDKPSGLIVHRGWADDEDTAADRAREIVSARVFACHRIDRGTSGVLLFALSSEIAAAIVLQGKRYFAAVRGRPPASGVIDHPVRRGEERDSPRVPAVTEFTSIATSPIARYSLVEARPLTGRLHQIRRHMKHISHPILGDVRYGKREHNHLCRDQFGLRRMALHAAELAIDHPVTGERVVIRAPLPGDLLQPLAAMGIEYPVAHAPGCIGVRDAAMSATADVANNTVTFNGKTYRIQPLGEDQYTVLIDGVPVGRILLSFGAPQGVPEGGMSEDDLYAIGEAWFNAVDAAS